jgi:hypothetical protein
MSFFIIIFSMVIISLIFVALFFFREVLLKKIPLNNNNKNKRRIKSTHDLIEKTKESRPLSVQLEHDSLHEWTKDSDCQLFIQDILALGFQPSSTYLIKEIPELKLASFFRNDFCAVLYFHHQKGYWFDIFFEQQDGFLFTYTNTPTQYEFSYDCENRKKEHKKNYSLEQLVKSLEYLTADRRGQKLNKESFKLTFEYCYQLDMEYRNKEGGLSFDEFMEHVDIHAAHLNEDEIKSAFLQNKIDELQHWHLLSLDLLSKTMPDLNKDEIFFVPEKTDALAFLYYIKEFGLVSQEQIERLSDSVSLHENIHTLFDIINKCLGDQHEFKHLFSVKFPVPAKVYQRGAVA